MKTHFAALIAACALLVGGCVSLPEHSQLAAAQPVFQPLAFFDGRSTGEATLTVLVTGTQPVRVESAGQMQPDGSLQLVQRITRGDSPATTRTWRLRDEGGGRYGGTLSTAESPVVGDVQGNRLHLHFVDQGGLDTEQWLYLRPGGKVADNRLVVRKFGLRVASLSETIRKAD